ncbi:MAG TPA: PDZ domain-containing protein [Lacipirellulaceae bacterium]|nr:PDZ domain-containing protein [Lacipirellulaceae bacterium]
MVQHARRADDGDEDEAAYSSDRLFVPRWRLTDGPHVRAAFREAVAGAGPATVVVKCDGRQRGLGGVIGADGGILTKATPLCGAVTCVLADGRELTGVTVGADRRYDLALVKVDAANLPTLQLAESAAPAVGSWLATVGVGRDPVAVGVVSVGPREVPPQPGVLGVVLGSADASRPVVEQVFAKSAAEQAGVRVGDRIISVDGVETTTREDLIARVRSYNPGDTVTLNVKRGDEVLALRATLQGTFPGMEGRSEFQNNLGGRLSVRRFGFPVALQHDTVLRPADCGGPIVDLDGRVVGFNIARAGRTESYAIPASAVRDVVRDLMASGMAALLQIEKESAGAAPSANAAPATPPAPTQKSAVGGAA